MAFNRLRHARALNHDPTGVPASAGTVPSGKIPGMQPRIMYIENKGIDGLSGPARIGRVTFSQSGRSIYYNGRTFQSLNGSGFTVNSKAVWNQVSQTTTTVTTTQLTTTFVSASQLTATVPASLLSAAGTPTVAVTTDGVTSNALTFTITTQ